MELHELPKGVEYEDMTKEEQDLTKSVTDKALLLGESIFRAARQLDGRPPVMVTAMIYALIRTSVEAGKNKAAARRMLTRSGETLTKLDGFEDAFESLWATYGREGE